MSEPKVTGASSAANPNVDSSNPVVIIDAAVPTPEVAEVEKKSDSFGRDQLPPEKSAVRDNGTTRRSGESPFAELARRAVPIPVRALSAARGIDAPIDLPFEVLEKAAALEAQLGPERVEVFAKLREGFMLVATDAQLTEACAMDLDTDGARSLAQTVVEKQSALSSADAMAGMHVQKAHFHGIDINAFVQYVLRESYLIQSELLYDYAQKVKHYNNLKKLTRERLKEMREIHTAWAERNRLLGTDVTYYSDDPVPYMVLTDNGEWMQELMSEEDVKNYVEQQKDQAADQAGIDPAVRGYWDDLNPSSELGGSEKDWLVNLASKNDDYIRDHLAELKELLPKMTGDDLKTYLLPILDKMRGGNSDEEEILEVYDALAPAQVLFLIANGYEEEKLNLGGNEKDEFILLARDAARTIAESLGGTLEDFDNFDDVMRQTPNPKSAKDVKKLAEAWELKGPEASRILGALSRAITEQDRLVAAAGSAATESGPAVGDPKFIRTAEEMENYISSLEEQLNTIGDDAQLANVDLQNALQKQQQTLQMMSNISKMLHDTAMSIIRKIGS